MKTPFSKDYFTSIELLFMSSIIAMDFAFSVVVGPLLVATGITQIIRIDQIVPVMFMLLTRLVIDKYGTLIIYEFAFGLLLVAAAPASFGGIPGFLKLIPALMYGILLDTTMQIIRRPLYVRLLLSSVVSGIGFFFVFLGYRILLGLPWSAAVQAVSAVSLAMTVIVYVIAVHLTLAVWRTVKRSGWVHRINAWRTT